MFLYLKTRTY